MAYACLHVDRAVLANTGVRSQDGSRTHHCALANGDEVSADNGRMNQYSGLPAKIFSARCFFLADRRFTDPTGEERSGANRWDRLISAQHGPTIMLTAVWIDGIDKAQQIPFWLQSIQIFDKPGQFLSVPSRANNHDGFQVCQQRQWERPFNLLKEISPEWLAGVLKVISV